MISQERHYLFFCSHRRIVSIRSRGQCNKELWPGSMHAFQVVGMWMRRRLASYHSCTGQLNIAGVHGVSGFPPEMYCWCLGLSGYLALSCLSHYYLSNVCTLISEYIDPECLEGKHDSHSLSFLFYDSFSRMLYDYTFLYSSLRIPKILVYFVSIALAVLSQQP